jgi:hypothetical protein
VAVPIGKRPRQLLLLSLVLLTGCGGNGHSQTTTATKPAYKTTQRDYSDYYPPGTHKPTREAARVITAWADQLRAGHVRRASAYFALHAIVQNASPPLRLDTRKEIVAWNTLLPCGAHVVKLIAGTRYTVATLVLTERPGSPSGCGATGKLAATAFLIRRGKITEWRRVLVPPPLGPEKNLKNGVPAGAS